MMKKNLFSISAMDKKGCNCDWWRRDTQIYDVEDFLNIFDHEKDKHKSSKSYDGEKHTVRDSSNSFKETKIKKESIKQTNISV